jgi:hypothetical protein
MKILITSLLVLFFFIRCNNNNAPDVSDIQVNIHVDRFDRFMFTQVDMSAPERSVRHLQEAYPSFTTDFIVNILGLPAIKPGSADSATLFTYAQLNSFLQLTRPLYDSLAPRFSDLGWLDKELTSAFKYVKYYFPEYKVPQVLSYIGPFDAPAIAITNDAIGIGLQLYAGSDFSFYTSTTGQEMYPMYISRRFEPPYIPVDCMKAVSADLFPDNSAGLPLIGQMIEKGKQWYLADKFLPSTHDTLKTGFSNTQLAWCEENEGLAWNFILKNVDIYTTEPAIIKTYLGESPHTQDMPGNAPGNIGQWIGWKIVRTYADKHPEITPGAIMQKDYKQILIESKYKPA